MITDKILAHIRDNNIEEAFLSIDDFLNESANCQDEITMLRQRFSEIVEIELKNTETFENISIKKNQIVDQLINLVSNIESFINPERNSAETPPNNDATTLKQIAQDAIIDHDLHIISELHKDRSSVFYKAQKGNSRIENDFCVVQLLNQYQLLNTKTKIDEKAYKFFHKCDLPFVSIGEIHDGNPSYIIREYIKGITLNTLVTDGMRLSLVRANKIIITLAEGLRDLHRSKLPYKKLIPSQVVMEPSGEARFLPMNIFLTNKELITWSQLKNSVKFMSPEELKQIGISGPQKPIDRASNQFSLGLILFFIFTGEPLYDGIGIRELCQDRLDDKQNKKQKTHFRKSVEQHLLQYGIPPKKVKSLSSKFNKIFNKLLEVEKENRYEAMIDLIEEMDRLNDKIKDAIQKQEGKHLPIVYRSFRESVLSNDALIDIFHNKLYELLPQIDMHKDKESRNTRLFYSLDYLLSSISNLDNPLHLKEATTFLIKEGTDYTLQDYDVFFKVLKDLILENYSDWNDSTNESWDYFINSILTSIEKHYFSVDVVAVG